MRLLEIKWFDVKVPFLLSVFCIAFFGGCSTADKAGSLQEAYWLMECARSDWRSDRAFEKLAASNTEKKLRAYYLLNRLAALSAENRHEDALKVEKKLSKFEGHLMLPYARFSGAGRERERIIAASGLKHHVSSAERFPLLIMLLNDPSSEVRLLAVSALKNGPTRDRLKALPYLSARLWEKDDPLLRYYASAIGQITGKKFSPRKWEGSEKGMIQAARKWANKRYDVDRLQERERQE